MPKSQSKSRKRKIKSVSSSRRRRFIGARIEFDGHEENGQIAQFRDGRQFQVRDIDDVIKYEFRWDIVSRYIFKNELGFERTAEERFKTEAPVRFNSLKDLAYEQGTRAGLGMPEGYVFDRNEWEAKIIG